MDGEVNDFINEFNYKIQQQIIEDEDGFIFASIKPFCEGVIGEVEQGELKKEYLEDLIKKGMLLNKIIEVSKTTGLEFDFGSNTPGKYSDEKYLDITIRKYHPEHRAYRRIVDKYNEKYLDRIVYSMVDEILED